ncbi:MAG: glycosyltransferase family 4 protein [Anaerolineales bacterium]
MLIGIDASRTTVAHRTGTEAYALNLIRTLLAAGVDHRWRLYYRQSPISFLISPENRVENRVIRMPRLWTHIGLAAETARRPPDGLFIPAHARPLWCRVPTVVTVHDLGYVHFPEAHPRRQRAYLDWSTRHSARRSARLIADSQATRNDLTRFYGTPPEKVSVVYPGFDSTPFAQTTAQPAGLPTEYLLYVGTIQPRKGLLPLLDALARVPNAPPLLLAGREGWLSEQIRQRVSELDLESRIRFLGYVSDEELPALYAGTTAFVLPSLYEGFGFPVLEAMAAGAPVLCSDGGSLPEVAGDAALVTPAGDVDALVDGLRRILSDSPLRAHLVERGHEQVKRFSWDKAAAETLALLENAFQ